MMHSSTRAGSTPARRIATATTSAPSWGAQKFLSEPRNFPVAVRTALTMTASRTNQNLPNHIVAQERLHPTQNDLRGTADLGVPGRSRSVARRRGERARNRGGERQHVVLLFSDAVDSGIRVAAARRA